MDRLLGHFAAHNSDRFGERDFLGTYAAAVLRIAAIGDAPFFHEDMEAVGGLVFAGRIGIEEAGLRDGCRADELRMVIDLRTCLGAAAAGHTSGEDVHHLLDFRADLGAKASFVGRVDLDPAADPFKGIEHRIAIDDQIADDRIFGERGKGNDRAFGRGDDLIDERRTGLSWAAIDEHGTRTANLLQASLLPNDGSDFFMAAIEGGFLNIHQGSNDIVMRLEIELKLFPILVARKTAEDF